MSNEFENGETKVFFLGFLEKQDSQNSVVTLRLYFIRDYMEILV